MTFPRHWYDRNHEIPRAEERKCKDNRSTHGEHILHAISFTLRGYSHSNNLNTSNPNLQVFTTFHFFVSIKEIKSSCSNWLEEVTEQLPYSQLQCGFHQDATRYWYFLQMSKLCLYICQLSSFKMISYNQILVVSQILTVLSVEAATVEIRRGKRPHVIPVANRSGCRGSQHNWSTLSVWPFSSNSLVCTESNQGSFQTQNQEM